MGFAGGTLRLSVQGSGSPYSLCNPTLSVLSPVRAFARPRLPKMIAIRGKYLQVRRIVIRYIAVNVMHDLGFQQRPADLLVHPNPMLQSIATRIATPC